MRSTDRDEAMARGNAVFDTDLDPFAARADRRRALMRIGVPILGVAPTIAVMLFIAVYANRANTRGALALSSDVLAALEGRITEQVAGYFGSAAWTLAVGRSLIEGAPPSEQPGIIEKFSIGALREIPPPNWSSATPKAISECFAAAKTAEARRS
jgi:hypothetical protein